MFAAAWLPVNAAGAANSLTFRDCSLVGGLDPDFVRLSGATVTGAALTVVNTQPSVMVEASESSDPGDNFGHDTFSVTLSGPGISPRTVSGAGVGHVSLAVPLSGVTPGGQYSLSWTATFDGGLHHCPGSVDPQNTTSHPFVLNVVAGPPPPPPTITRFRESHRRWAEHAGAGGAPVGTKFRFDLSEPARVRLAFKKVIHGRGRARGGLSLQRGGGPNSVRFAGKLPSGRLAPGRYVVVITATDAAGQRSAPRSVAFTIVA